MADETRAYAEALLDEARSSDGRNAANAGGQHAIAAAIIYAGDELRALRQSIEGVTRAGGVPLADVVAGAVDLATTEVANAARSIAQHGGGWQR